MTTFDFSPLLRATVGFDRLTRMLEDASRAADATNGYPPYNIEKLGDNRYRITIAVAGFGEDELAVQVHENTLSIEGQRNESDSDRTLLYRGIAGRGFKRQFQLADHVVVDGAHLNNGLLVIDLKREIPEAMKPRRIEIGTTAPSDAKLADAKPADGNLIGSGKAAA